MTRSFRLVLLLVVLVACWVAPGAAQPPPPEPAVRLIDEDVARGLRDGEILLNYESIDIRILAKIMSELTGRNIVLDDRVQGRVTVLSARPVSIAQAWDVFKAALRRYGFVVREEDDFVQVVPAAEARRTSRVVGPGKAPYKGEDMVLAIMLLRHANPDVVQNAVRQLISEVGFVIPYKEGNALIVAERAETVAQITKLVQTLDTLHQPSHTSVIFPEYLAATEVVTLLQQLLASAFPTAKFQAFEAANAVVIYGEADAIARSKALIQRIDIPSAAPRKVEPPRFYVYHLQNAQAEQVAEILSQMLQEKKQAAGELEQAPGRAPGGRQVPTPAHTPSLPNIPTPGQPTSDVSSPYATSLQQIGAPRQEQAGFISAAVSADPDTNSLVFYLSPTEFEELQPVIARLDLPRKQVQISAVVAEVSLRRMLEIGTRFQVVTQGGLLTSYKGGVTEEGLLSFLASGNFLVGAVGGTTRTINIGGRNVNVPEAFAFLNALEDSSDFNLISAPRVVTQDHKEAVINVGEVVPFATGARFDTFGQPLVTYDYREVGIKLEVTPHVSQTNKVRLELNQEIQEVTDFLQQDLGGFGYIVPIISNRNVNTTVTVPDGQTIMIGGLISKRTLDAIQKVPILGDLPLIGQLFRDSTKEEEKTTVFISMTPTIVESPEELPELDRPYEDFLKGQQDPGDHQTEDRSTLERSELLPGAPSEAPAAYGEVDPARARAARILLGDFRFDRPVGPGKVGRPVVTLENAGEVPVELEVVGTVTRPDGTTVALPGPTVVARPGTPMPVTLPHYVFPEEGGVYTFDVAARLGGEVVSRLAEPGRMDLGEVAPKPTTPLP